MKNVDVINTEQHLECADGAFVFWAAKPKRNRKPHS